MILIITEPEPLNVSSKVSSLKNEVTLDLKGGKYYVIELNGERFETAQNQITIPLKKIENVLSVKTDVECQGVYNETIVLSDKILVYPNPISSGNLNIYLGAEAEFDNVTLAMYSVNGTKVISKEVVPNNGNLKLNMNNFANGMYILNIKSTKSLMNYKIIKR